MSMDWYDVDSCNYCGHDGQRLYLESDVPKWYGGHDLRLVECTNCGLVYASPRPVIEQLYKGYIEGNEHVQQAVKRKLERKNVHEVHRKHLDDAIGFLGYEPTRVFDMGCGAGTVMMAAAERKLEAWGNDINKAAIDMLCGLGFNAHHGFTTELDLPDAYFDIVINFDYLEHSYTPAQDLQVCHRILKPNGLMYLKTLYLDCPQHLEKGAAWQLFGAGHFHYFSLPVLQRMIESAGFRIEHERRGQLVFIAARRA